MNSPGVYMASLLIDLDFVLMYGIKNRSESESHSVMSDFIVHGILQARILDWAAFPFSGGSSQPRDRTQVCHIAGRFFTN